MATVVMLRWVVILVSCLTAMVSMLIYRSVSAAGGKVPGRCSAVGLDHGHGAKRCLLLRSA